MAWVFFYFNSVDVDMLVRIVAYCRGPAPADPGYSKWGQRRRPI